MDCKLNIKAANGKNSKLYKDIAVAIKDPARAVDTYYFTKTDDFKKAYTGSMDANGEPIYSQFSDEAYNHEVDYNNIELDRAADVYKKLIKEIPKIKDLISTRLDSIRHSKTKSKKHIKQLTELFELLDNQPINSSVPKFIDSAKTHALNLKKSAEKEFRKSGNDITKLAGIYKVAESYRVLEDLKKALTLSSEVSDIFSDNIRSMSNAIGNINSVEEMYMEKSVDYLADEFHKRDKTWSKKKIKEELTHASSDTLWVDNMLEYVGDSSDRVMSMVATVMMEAEHRKRREVIRFSKELEKQVVKLESKYNQKDIMKELTIKAPNGEFHVVDLNAKFTDGKNLLSDAMYKRVQELKSKPEMLEFARFYHKTMQSLEAQLPSNARLGTRLPTVLKSEFELLEGKNIQEKGNLIQDNLVKKFQRSNLDQELGVYTDTAGKPLKRIPTFYTQRYDSADYDVKYESVRNELLEQGKTEEVADTAAHKAAEDYAIAKMSKIISTDLVHSLQAFHAMATNYAAKNELIHIFESAEALVSSKYRSYNKVDSAGKVLKDKSTGRIKTIGGEESTTGKLITAFLEMQLYGQKEKDLGFVDIAGYKVDTNKILRAINSGTGLTMQAGNILGGINNMTLGEATNINEAIAGEYYKTSDYKKASRLYADNLTGIISDIGNRTPKNLINLLDEHYNILQSYEGGDIKLSETTKAKRLFKTSSLYFIQAAGEHSMQIRAGLAALNNIKVYTKSGAEKGSLLDNHTIVDGKLQVPSDLYIKEKDGTLVQFDTIQQNRISNKVGALLRKMHGNYSSNTASRMQQDARTALVMKFRGWIYEGIKRRYGKKRDYHMLETEMEGFYRTGGKAAVVLLKDLKSLSLNLSKENWRGLTPHEQANIRRFVSEATFIIVTGAAGAMLGHAGKMMDDEFDSDSMGDRMILGSYAMLNYQVNRLYTELFAYMNPQEAVKLLATPAASVSMVENTIKLLTQFVGAPLEQYETGWRKGDYKLAVRAQKLIPLYKQIETLTLNADAIKDKGIYFINN